MNYTRNPSAIFRCSGPLCLNKSSVPIGNEITRYESTWKPAEIKDLSNALVPISCSNKQLNTFDPAYVMPPSTMQLGMEHVKFPNLPADVRTRGVNAGGGPINLTSRHTPYEWSQINFRNYAEADTNRNVAEKLRSDASRVIREAEEKTYCGQRNTCRRITERLSDIAFWKHELAMELEKMVSETRLLQHTKKELEKSIDDCNPPLYIAQECLYHREGRQGIDLVRDQAEESLLQEVATLQQCKEKLNFLHQKVIDQLRDNRSSQHELELDLKSKESALEIDCAVQQLSNFSTHINYYPDVDKFDQTISVPESWAEHSNRIVQKSQQQRVKSTQLRTESENMMSDCCNNIWNAWNFTNNALSRRANETLETKNKLQMHLHKVQQELYDSERSMDMLRKAIADKSNPLKVAQTRLEVRTHRRDIELCRDLVHTRLASEVHELQSSINQLNQKLKETESQHQQLLLMQSELEKNLHLKVNSLFIDREKCLGMRKACPITSVIRF